MKLQNLYTSLNMLDTQRICYQLLHKKPRLFEYRDKLDKCFTYLLAETPENKTNISMQNSLGACAWSCDQIIKHFAPYYMQLYTSADSEQPSVVQFEALFPPSMLLGRY